jgi:hypothetical protein
MTNTIQTTYDALQKQVSKILTERGAKRDILTFSMFDEVNYNSPDNWVIKAPEFNTIFTVGKVKFIGEHGFKTKVLNSPTWADVAHWANESILFGMKKHGLDGWDHVFLEEVELKEEVKGVKVFEFWFGS